MASPAKLSDLSILLLSEKDDTQGGLFQEHFHNFPNASVTKNPFEDLETVDCLVIPCASSYCSRDNEIAEQYFRYVRKCSTSPETRALAQRK